MASRVAAAQVEPLRPSRTQAAAAASGHSSSKSSRRRSGAPYRVERVRNAAGLEQEVLTLEDTPEPGSASSSRGAVAQPHLAGPSYTNGNAYASTSTGARRDPYSGYEPSGKKRRVEPAVNGTESYPDYRAAYPTHPQDLASNYAAPTSTTGSSGLKRKHDDHDRQGRDPQRPRVQEDLPRPIVPISDQDGHYIVRIDATIADPRRNTIAYRIIKQLGQGTFGKVVEAQDLQSPARYALKIIRNVHKYQEAAKTEIRVLKELRNSDMTNRHKCIPLLDTFDYYGHTCLVTPLLGISVFDFLKENQYEPFPLSHVQSFARQLLNSIGYVHRRKLVHTDLKPENILLQSNSWKVVPGRRNPPRKLLTNTDIQLIDFGSATYENEYHASVVSTRHYRAPEIILCTGWSYPCDMWSIGCILVEFVTGEALFQTHDNLEHLAMMEAVFGKMPQNLVDQGQKRTGSQHPDWFKRSGRSKKYELNFPQPSTQKQSSKFVKGMKRLRDIIAPRDAAGEAFLQLCTGLLHWDPANRWTVRDALKCDFISDSLKIDDEGSFAKSVNPLTRSR